MKYYKKMIGPNCYLSPISYDDLDKYTEWVNDMETGLYVLFSSMVIDTNREQGILEYLTKHDVILAVIDKESNKAIGICGFHNRSEVHRTATFGIFIGEKSYWGHGIGTEATMLALDFAFNMLNLNSIILEVIDYNKRAIKCYEKCGFKYIGKKRQAIFIAGIYHDVLLYDIVKGEFTSPYIKKLYETSTISGKDKDNITIV